MSLASLQAALHGIERLSLDTSVFIADGTPADPRQVCAQWLVDQVEMGRFQCVISALTAAEMLVRPQRSSPQDGAAAQAVLRDFPHLIVESFTLDLAATAARVRASTRLRLPDAIILATALSAGVDAIVHTDDAWDAKTRPYAGALRIVNLNRYCP